MRPFHNPSHRLLPPRPVFLDRSGQRRRRVVMIGAALATTLITGLIVLVIGFVGPSGGHVPSFPGADGIGSPSTPPTESVKVSSTGATATAPKPAATPAAVSPSPSRRHYPTRQPPKPSKSR